jgi:cytochrome c biogenesis protein ResB
MLEGTSYEINNRKQLKRMKQHGNKNESIQEEKGNQRFKERNKKRKYVIREAASVV